MAETQTLLKLHSLLEQALAQALEARLFILCTLIGAAQQETVAQLVAIEGPSLGPALARH